MKKWTLEITGWLGEWSSLLVIAVLLLGPLWLLDRVDLCDLVTMASSIALYHGFSRRQWESAVVGVLGVHISQGYWWVALWPYTQ